MQALIEQARQCEFYRTALEDLARALPSDDGELNAVITEAIAARDERAFRSLFFAAIGTGRQVDAQHLAEGSALFEEPNQLLHAARACVGDVASALLAAVQAGRMGVEREASALLLAWIWCEDHKAAVPAGFWATARSLARRTSGDVLTQSMLVGLARGSKDEGLTAILGTNRAPGMLETAEHVLPMCREMYQGSPWEAVPERRPPTMLSGYTVRRAVPRVGRNDPCPCGSGKKYKKCCFEKDQQRLLQSSAVAGMTVDEWRTQPEMALTIDRLRQMRSYELVKLDPVKVPPELHEHFLDRLLVFKEHETIIRYFETIPFHEDLEFYWDWAIETAGSDRQLEVARRLLAVRPGFDPTQLPLNVRLLLAGDEGAALLDLVEAEARLGLRDGDGPSAMVPLAYSLLESRAPALGVLVARGLLPLVGPMDGDMLLDSLLQARDQLELSSDDPIEKIFQERFTEAEEAPRESEAMAAVQRDLESKSDQVNRLRAELKSVYREMEKRRHRATVTAVETKPVAPDDSAMTELRAKINSLQSMLKERHGERNQLRRELQRAHEQLARTAPSPPVAEPKADAANREDELLLAEPTLGKQPVRVPEFPAKFAHTMADLPRSVVRAALVLTARLAAGEAAAFVGLRPLRAWPEVYRQRVGGDYRLLFRLHADRLEVVDLINRRDLERTIKSRG